MGKGNGAKKPITKRWWFWAIVVLLVAGIAGSIGGDDSTADAPESSPVVEDTAQPETTDDTRGGIAEPGSPEPADSGSPEPSKAEPVEPSEPTDGAEGRGEEPEEDTLDLETVVVLCRVVLSQNFGDDHYSLEYDDAGMTVNFWMDNIALGAAAAANGDKDTKESWDTLVESQKSLCNSFVEQIEKTGKENYIVMFNVLNDMDKSKTLLTIMNGVVVYDVVNS